MRPAYYLCVFAAAVLLGGGWWATTGEACWWAGYDGPDGFVPEFKFRWYEQAVVAGLVGLPAAVPAALALYGFDRLGRLRR